MDYYATLGLSRDKMPRGRTGFQRVLKAAYRKRMSETHPDLTHGDESGFKEAVEAYRVLSDPQRRQLYDNAEWSYGSLEMLFGSHPDARRLLESTVASIEAPPPAVPVPGQDLFLVRRLARPDESAQIQSRFRWRQDVGNGLSGKNGAPSGDGWTLVTRRT